MLVHGELMHVHGLSANITFSREQMTLIMKLINEQINKQTLVMSCSQINNQKASPFLVQNVITQSFSNMST